MWKQTVQADSQQRGCQTQELNSVSVAKDMSQRRGMGATDALESLLLASEVCMLIELEGTSLSKIRDLQYDHDPGNFLVKKVIKSIFQISNYRRNMWVGIQISAFELSFYLSLTVFFFNKILISLWFCVLICSLIIYFSGYWDNQIVTNCPQIQ